MRKRSDTDIVFWCLSQELCTIYLFNVFRDALFAILISVDLCVLEENNFSFQNQGCNLQ